MSLSKGREDENRFSKGGSRGKDTLKCVFWHISAADTAIMKSEFSYQTLNVSSDQPEKTYIFIGQETHTIHDSITWNHGNRVLGKEVTWCLTSCYFTLRKVRINYIVVTVKRYWNLRRLKNTEHVPFLMTFMFQTSVQCAKETLWPAYPDGENGLLYRSGISYPLEGSLKLSNSTSLAHTLEIYLFKRPHLNAKQQ